MAFEKRTWFARLGLGLNKFIIGDKDAEGKQELTNSPDSITQQGDVISADNLNDLEDRIQAGFNGMMLTKVWENPSPTASFAGQNIVVNTALTDVIIEFFSQNIAKQSLFSHFKYDGTKTSDYPLSATTFWISEAGELFSIICRRFDYTVNTNSTTFGFRDCRQVVANGLVPTWAYNTTNELMVPYRIYAVGDIYK